MFTSKVSEILLLFRGIVSKFQKNIHTGSFKSITVLLHLALKVYYLRWGKLLHLALKNITFRVGWFITLSIEVRYIYSLYYI